MGKIFLRGLLAITPVAITLSLFIWIFGGFEAAFSVPLKKLIGEKYYFPGLGIIVALILIFFIGTIINNFLIQKIYQFNDRILRRIPLIKTIYNAINDLVQFFQVEGKEKLGKVVVVDFHSYKLIGFITRDHCKDLPIGGEEGVVVYIPFSYQIGGYTFIMPRSAVTEIEMNVEEAMRFAITAGMLKTKPTGDKK